MAGPITPEDLYRFRWIDHVRLSPNGERVAYQVGWADATSRQNRSRIVVRGLLEPEPVGPSAGVLRDHSPEWSPDGRKLAFLSRVGPADQLFVLDLTADGPRLVVAGNAEPGADLQRELNLYMVDLEANRMRLGGGFYLSSPIWSPKGDQIAFIAPNGLDVGLLERLWVVPLSGGGPRCLTANFDQAVNDSVINDMRAGHATRVCWSDEGDRIYFVASGPGVTTVNSVDLEGDVREEVGGRRRIYDFDVASGVVAFCASDPGSPGELYMLTHGSEARVTDMNPWLRDRYVAQPEQEYFSAPDGWKLEGWVLKPADHDPSRAYPTVMEIHGGPHAQYGWTFFHELQVLAGMGYVVFYMNPRAPNGYGERFRRDVVRDWAGKDYLDLMSSLDQLIDRKGYIDTNRLGVGGGSYGGYMTNWIIGQTNRFSAAVAMRSISNLVSEYSQHDIVLWGTLQLGPPPW